MYEDIQELIEEIDNVYKGIGNSFPIDKRIALVELTRCIDHSFVFASFVISEEHEGYTEVNETFQYLSTGFIRCLNLFYDSNTNLPGCPFYPSSKEMIDWANSILLRCGHIGYTLRFIELATQGLFSIKKQKYTYYFTGISETPGLENFGKEDFDWWQSQNFLNEAENKLLKTLYPVVQETLEKVTDVWSDFFIKYTCTEDLDEYYDLLGNRMSRILAGYDAFPDEAYFNGLSYLKIKKIVQALVGYSLKHKDHCATLLKKTNYKINLWNVYTQPELVNDLAESIQIHKNIPKDKVLEILNILTLSEKNIESLAKVPGGAPPPLIKIGRDHVLKSIAGCLCNPFSFLTIALKSNYEKDYFTAVNYREQVFKQELYNLFDIDSIHHCDTNINLKSNLAYLTDIDALLYDEVNRCLLVTQLKWLDNFGTSMKMRASMSKNFYASSIKWVQSVSNWIEKNGEIELLKRINTVKRLPLEVKSVKLMILGRNFSHFSDHKDEKKAVWASWYTLKRVLHENPELKSNLLKLAIYLEDNSFEKRKLPNMPTEHLNVGRYTINITI